MKMSDILSLFHQGSTTAKSHMKNLIEIAAADGQFHDMEYDLLKSIAKRNGISETKLKEIKSNPSGIKFEIPADPKVKFEQLYDLVHMMSIDTSVHDEELKLCNLFAIKFGYKREIVPELISTIRGNIQNKQSSAETMKRVQMMLV
ncbi:MAG: TerB family tellurite resistance protein [Cyclobacteriaceae bacterium]|nr:TerB family tellurite resistance protein [Cyclobacteriaceae bacterium]